MQVSKSGYFLFFGSTTIEHNFTFRDASSALGIVATRHIYLIYKDATFLHLCSPSQGSLRMTSMILSSWQITGAATYFPWYVPFPSGVQFRCHGRRVFAPNLHMFPHFRGESLTVGGAVKASERMFSQCNMCHIMKAT